MRVELDIFSGRENPTWNLGIKEAALFIEKFRSLPGITGEVSGWNGLGYRGVIVRNRLIEDLGFSEIKIYCETVSAIGKNKQSNYSDAGRALELWLIKTGREQVGDQLYESVLAEII